MRSSLLLSTLALLSGCADFQFNLAVDSTAAVLSRGSKSLDMEPDVDLARDALPGTIKTIDTFLAAAPENPIFLELTAKAYVQYAFGFLEDDLESMSNDVSPLAKQKVIDRATSLYDRGYEVGLRMVALEDKDFAAEFTKADTQDKALKETTEKYSAAGLYWAGFALASGINLHRDDVNRIAELPRATALLERSRAVDPTYFNHGATLTLAVIYSSQGKAMGGNPEKAKQYFDEVIAATGGKFLMAKVMLARFYATVTLDRALFEKTLKEVLDTPASVMPEARLANELAHRRAQRYLDHAEDYF